MGIFLMQFSSLLIFVLFVWAIGYGIQYIIKKSGKIKFREILQLFLACFFISGAVLMLLFFRVDYDEGLSNMSNALQACDRMLTEGKREQLTKIVDDFNTSEIMKKRGNIIAKTFNFALAGKTVPSQNSLLTTTLKILITNFIFILIWTILYYLKRNKWRDNFTLTSTALAIVVLIIAYLGWSVNNGYFSDHIRWDINKLSEQLKKPELTQEFRNRLQSPQQEAYSFFRGIQRETSSTQ